MEITDNQILAHEVISLIEDKAREINGCMFVKDVLEICKEARKRFSCDGLDNDIEEEQKREDTSPYN